MTLYSENTGDGARGIIKEVVIGDCRLILGDMIDVVPHLPKVNMICSDVPYLLESGGNTTGEMKGKFAKERYDNTGHIIKCDIRFDEFMPVCFEVMPIGHAYFMVNNRNVSALQIAAENAGFHFHNLLTWDKGSATPNRWYMKNLEFTVECLAINEVEYAVMVKSGRAFPVNDCGQKQLTRCPAPRNALHDTQKPVALMEQYVGQSTQKGDVVLDPFMGSGTTGVACVKLGRKFTGVELDSDYFEIACERIRKAYEQPDMFVSPQTKPIELNQGGFDI